MYSQHVMVLFVKRESEYNEMKDNNIPDGWNPRQNHTEYYVLYSTPVSTFATKIFSHSLILMYMVLQFTFNQ